MNRIIAASIAALLVPLSVFAQSDNLNTAGFVTNFNVTITPTIPVQIIGENNGLPGRRALHVTFPLATSAGCYLFLVDGNNAANLAAMKASFSNAPSQGIHISPAGPIVGWTWDAHDLWQKTILAVSDTAGSNAFLSVVEPRGNKP